MPISLDRTTAQYTDVLKFNNYGRSGKARVYTSSYSPNLV